LKVPDRVPVWFQDAGYFPAKYVGITCEEAMFNSDKLFAAYKKALVDFAPDMYFNPGSAIHSPGGALEAVNCMMIKLPGRGVSPLYSHQFVEGEYMKAEEYYELINDPTDFAMRKYLPRIFGALKPLETLPPLNGLLGGTMCISGMIPLSLLQVGTPEKVKAYAKELIDRVGKGGGFIMGPRSIMDEANPELVKVWVEFTKEYGVYR